MDEQLLGDFIKSIDWGLTRRNKKKMLSGSTYIPKFMAHNVKKTPIVNVISRPVKREKKSRILRQAPLNSMRELMEAL